MLLFLYKCVIVCARGENMKMSEKLVKLRTEKDLTQQDIAKIAGVSDKAVSSWENEARSPKLGSIQKMCEYFNIDFKTFIDESNDEYNPCVKLPKEAMPYAPSHKAPIVGSIPAGYPIIAFENIEGYADIPYFDEENYFFLRINGDSMEPKIHTGDLVLIRKQNCAEDGQIVAARVNGDEATLKRYKKQGDTVLLLPENPEYNPYIVPINDFETGYAQIIGIALEVRHTL